jgi:hypothetical protein
LYSNAKAVAFEGAEDESLTVAFVSGFGKA